MDRLAVMETFVRVVETGSFSAAARLLNVGQPAVSKSIAQLEQRLGVRLLIRSTRGLKPTEAGLNFHVRARRVIEEADSADLAARGSGAGMAGRLCASAPVTFSRLHIVPQLHRFLAHHPGITVDLMMSDCPIDLVREGVDVALRMGTLRDSALMARKIASARRVVVGAPSFFERAGIPKTPEALARCQAVIYTMGSGGDSWRFRRGNMEAPVTLSGRLRISAAEGVRAAVISGAGFTIASQWMFARELASGAVRAVLEDWELPEMDLWGVYPAGRLASAKARAFVDFVAAALDGSHSPAAYSPAE